MHQERDARESHVRQLLTRVALRDSRSSKYLARPGVGFGLRLQVAADCEQMRKPHPRLEIVSVGGMAREKNPDRLLLLIKTLQRQLLSLLDRPDLDFRHRIEFDDFPPILFRVRKRKEAALIAKKPGRVQIHIFQMGFSFFYRSAASSR